MTKLVALTSKCPPFLACQVLQPIDDNGTYKSLSGVVGTPPDNCLMSVEESCKARTAMWFLCDLVEIAECIEAYDQVVEGGHLTDLVVWEPFSHYDASELAEQMEELCDLMMVSFK